MRPLIYVVDDNPAMLELSQTVLDSKYRVRTFSNPEDAENAFRTERPKPNLLLTDYEMAEMTGLQLIDRCRGIDPELKTLLLSGAIDLDDLENDSTHIDGFLRKPFSIPDFVERVDSMVTRRQ